MHVAREMHIPIPCPQPSTDTGSVTVSGQWTTREPTGKRLPQPSRECLRQKLVEAAASGRLAIRKIQLAQEIDYFAIKRSPRPFTLVREGIPTSGLSYTFGDMTVGIINPQYLYIYKWDANTADVLYGADPDELKTKRLPDLSSLWEKGIMEWAERAFWPVYASNFTSGHLGQDGLFSLPKLKSAYAGPLPFPELVAVNYGVADIKCFYVERNPSHNISAILQAKRRCEQALDLKLPLVVYCKRTGAVEVCFDDELDSEHLALNEASLDEFALFHNVPPDIFRAMLNLLPMPIHAEALKSKLLTVSPEVKSKWQQAFTLVSDPCQFSYQKLLELKESGLPIHQHFLRKGTSESLLGELLVCVAIRHSNGQELTREQEKEVYRLLQLLLQSGASLEGCFCVIDHMHQGDAPKVPAGILNYLVAAFAPFDGFTPAHFRSIPLTGCPGGVVEFDRICRGYRPEQLQSSLEKALHYVRELNPPTLDILQSHLLALFYYGASLRGVLKPFKAYLTRSYRNGRKIIDNFSLADYIEWLDELWKQRKDHPFYRNWPEHVQKARRKIHELKQSLALPGHVGAKVTPLAAGAPTALQFMVDAFSKSPVLPDHVGDNEKTILTVLQHYYRRPGPERVIQSLGRKTMPTVWKPLHSCSHVLRARINGQWYMELLKKFAQCDLGSQEIELLALAIIYHDAAAEDVGKSMEETRSAEYFQRDLAGYYPQPLLENMARALASKENDVNGIDEQGLPESLRWYLRIIRFADRMDFIRVSGVRAEFPRVKKTQPRSFDATRLDLPPELPWDFTPGPGHRSEFQQHLEAAMHGAADLAQVTGRPDDQRKKKYTEVYGLMDNGSEISRQFEWTAQPVESMNRFIDDNVRRKIAQQAGIIVCSDDRHQACRADQKKGITYGIHNTWYDLRQVRIPEGMTLLEKMQYGHDPSLLSLATQQALAQEVQRLKSEGIRMNPGTLTQKTLASPKAQVELGKRGIVVISEKRCYFTDDGRQHEKEVLIPRALSPQ